MREAFISPLSEVKFADGNTMSFAGYGAVFGNVDSYGDVISPGAFAKTLADGKKSGSMPSMLLQHGGGFLGGGDDMMPIGVWTDMKEDSKGLWVEGQLADTQRGRDAYTLMKMQPRPAIDGLSIGFRPIEWTMRSKPEDPRRTLKAVDLIEVSLVTFPANGKARVTSIKSVDEIITIRDLEEALRDAGYSRKQAEAVSSRFQAKADQGEPDGDEALTAAAAAFLKSIKG